MHIFFVISPSSFSHLVHHKPIKTMVISRHYSNIAHQINASFLEFHLSELLSEFITQTKRNKPNIFPMWFNVSLYFHNIIFEHYSNHQCAVPFAAAIYRISDNQDFSGFTTHRHFTSISFLDTILPSHTHCIHKRFPTKHFVGIHRIHISIQKYKSTI